MKKLKLLVSERLSAIEFLPKEGSTSDQLTGRDILNKTKLSKEEREKVHFFNTPEGYVVDEETDFEKTVDFTDEEFKMLADGWRRLEDKEKITQNTIGLAVKLRDAIDEERMSKKK